VSAEGARRDHEITKDAKKHEEEIFFFVILLIFVLSWLHLFL
jgi:hypothetical protein